MEGEGLPLTPICYEKTDDGRNDWSLPRGAHIVAGFMQDYLWLCAQSGVDVAILKQSFIKPDTGLGHAIQAKIDEAPNPAAKRWWKTVYQHALGLVSHDGNRLPLQFMNCLQRHLEPNNRKLTSLSALNAGVCYRDEGKR